MATLPEQLSDMDDYGDALEPEDPHVLAEFLDLDVLTGTSGEGAE